MTRGADGGRPQERLRRQIEHARPGGGTPAAQRGLMLLGAFLLPLGLAVIVLGWLGAATTPRLFEQIPYLISGGLLGLGLVFTGGFLYFAYWLTRLVAEMREHTERVDALLSRLDQRHMDTPAAAALEELVATPRGSQYHRRICPVVAGRDDVRPLRPDVSAGSPCKICQPDAGPPANLTG